MFFSRSTIIRCLQLEYHIYTGVYTLLHASKTHRNSICKRCRAAQPISVWISSVRHLTACDYNYFNELNRNACSLALRCSAQFFFNIHLGAMRLNSIMVKKNFGHFHDYGNNEHFSAAHYINGSGNNGIGHWSDCYVPFFRMISLAVFRYGFFSSSHFWLQATATIIRLLLRPLLSSMVSTVLRIWCEILHWNNEEIEICAIQLELSVPVSARLISRFKLLFYSALITIFLRTHLAIFMRMKKKTNIIMRFALNSNHKLDSNESRKDLLW